MKNRNLNHQDDWMTPPEFYNKLNKIYGFDFDPCPFMHDLSEWDGLNIEWGNMNFVNPPYSLQLKTDFVIQGRMYQLLKKESIFLLPVSTSTKLFHNHIKNFAEIEFIEGRLPFIGWNSKGQKVNWHLIEQSPNDYIEYNGDLIPLHVKNSGMHDSMIVKFLK